MASEKPAVRGLERLIEGNERFVAEATRVAGPAGLQRVLSAQDPFAVVLTCADARVVPELIFDETIGRLFVVRVAGNVPGPEEMGSIEYAVDRFGCPLVLVLGHTRCGAVALSMPDNPDGWEPSRFVAASPGVKAIVDRIKENLDPLEDIQPERSRGAWRAAVEQNVRSAVERVRGSSTMIAAASGRRTVVVGAVYDVETGEVEFLDE